MLLWLLNHYASCVLFCAAWGSSPRASSCRPGRWRWSGRAGPAFVVSLYIYIYIYVYTHIIVSLFSFYRKYVYVWCWRAGPAFDNISGGNLRSEDFARSLATNSRLLSLVVFVCLLLTFKHVTVVNKHKCYVCVGLLVYCLHVKHVTCHVWTHCCLV